MNKIKTLPFYLQNGDYLDILDKDDVIIATVNTHQNDVEIGEYIVESCNNYSKAIELLKEAINQLESWKREDEENSFTMRRINEFLKSVENE